MKKFYGVTTTFDDRGRVTAALTDVIEARTRPDNDHIFGPCKDVYTDWFPTEKRAMAFVAVAQGA